MPASLTIALQPHLERAWEAGGGWMGFDAFMQVALYTPGLGYYARGEGVLGAFPASPRAPGGGSDFITAPQLSPFFARALARQVAQALAATQTDAVWEFGAGTGVLAQQLLQELQALDALPQRYTIVDVSAGLRAQQQARLASWGQRVHWVDALPPALEGVVLGNEVLDALPVRLLARVRGQWWERGVTRSPDGSGWCWQDRPTDLRPPLAIAGDHDYLTEIHPQAEALVATVGRLLRRGAVFWVDYGFPAAEYYHPQRSMGTVMCHQSHRADSDPLVDIGTKDITAHVNFTGIALAANAAGLDVLGYCNQARFLMNCGVLDLLAQADWPARIQAQKLLLEHEMGELFKVIGLCKGPGFEALGFATGDRTHTL